MNLKASDRHFRSVYLTLLNTRAYSFAVDGIAFFDDVSYFINIQ